MCDSQKPLLLLRCTSGSLESTVFLFFSLLFIIIIYIISLLKSLLPPSLMQLPSCIFCNNLDKYTSTSETEEVYLLPVLPKWEPSHGVSVHRNTSRSSIKNVRQTNVVEPRLLGCCYGMINSHHCRCFRQGRRLPRAAAREETVSVAQH